MSEHPFDPRCPECVNGPEPIEATYARYRGYIDDYGWGAVGVLDDATTPGFMYTVGLLERQHPELIVSALPYEMAHGWLGHFVAPVLRGERLHEGLNNAECGCDVKLIPVDEPAEQLCVAELLYGEQLRALQVVWPDRYGHFPGHPLYAAAHPQELFGPAPGGIGRRCKPARPEVTSP